MKEILLLGYARENSTRIPYKMTTAFGEYGNSLYDIYLNKYINISKRDNPFTRVVMALNPKDKQLWEKTIDEKLPIIERNDYSSNAPADFKAREMFHFLENCDEEYVMWVNACFPFLEVETILKIGNLFAECPNIDGLHCVRKKHNWFWNEDGTIINPDNEPNVHTQNIRPILESVHCVHIYNREYLLDNGTYWPFKKDNPYLYLVDDDIEFFDIDTENEFDIAERIWQSRYRL